MRINGKGRKCRIFFLKLNFRMVWVWSHIHTHTHLANSVIVELHSHKLYFLTNSSWNSNSNSDARLQRKTHLISLHCERFFGWHDQYPFEQFQINIVLAFSSSSHAFSASVSFFQINITKNCTSWKFNEFNGIDLMLKIRWKFGWNKNRMPCRNVHERVMKSSIKKVTFELCFHFNTSASKSITFSLFLFLLEAEWIEHLSLSIRIERPKNKTAKINADKRSSARWVSNIWSICRYQIFHCLCQIISETKREKKKKRSKVHGSRQNNKTTEVLTC